MKELRFKSALFGSIVVTVYLSIVVVYLCVVGIIVTYFLQNQRNFNDVFIIGSLVVLSFWIIEAIVIIFNPTIVVTETEIKKCFWKKKKEREKGRGERLP